MTELEKDIETKLRKMVERHGGLCLKWVCPGWSGVPDRLILLPRGRILFVELKRPKGGKREELQKWWARRLTRLGFLHFWVLNSKDVADLEKIVKAMLTEEVQL
jgi:hypothetical protein